MHHLNVHSDGKIYVIDDGMSELADCPTLKEMKLYESDSSFEDLDDSDEDQGEWDNITYKSYRD